MEESINNFKTTLNETAQERKVDFLTKNDFMINIEDVLNSKEKRKVNSPRTLEACKIEGILPEELIYRTESFYFLPGIDKNIQKMKYDTFEKKRQEMIQIVKKQRDKLLRENSRPLNQNPSQTYYLEKSRHTSSVLNNRTGLSRLSYDDLVNKGKERELFLIEKILRNEEMKNNKYEENLEQMNKFRAEQKRKEELLQKEIRIKSQQKIMQELSKQDQEKIIVKKDRKISQLKLKEMLKNQEEENKKLLLAEKKKAIIKQQIEEKRKIKAERAELIQIELLRKQEQKINSMNRKTRQIESLVEQRKKELQFKSELKKEKMKKIMNKVNLNIHMDNMNRYELYTKNKKRMEDKEKKIKQIKDMQIEELRHKSSLRNQKIQNAIEESEKQMEERKKHIIQRQVFSEKRFQKEQEKIRYESQLRKAVIELNNTMKRINSEHKMRRDEYKNAKVREKLEFYDERTSKYKSIHDEIKNKRLKNQTTAQFQRELVREALNQMAVWNVYNLDLVKKIIQDPIKGRKGPTTQELIRRRVGQTEIMKKMHLSYSNKNININEPSSALGNPNYFSNLSNISQPAELIDNKVNEMPVEEKDIKLSISKDEKKEGKEEEFKETYTLTKKLENS